MTKWKTHFHGEPNTHAAFSASDWMLALEGTKTSTLSCGAATPAKVYSGRRAKKLAKSVKQWGSVPSLANNTPRQAGWVTRPHRSCRKTVPVAVRTPTETGGDTDSVWVTTDLQASLTGIVTAYDKRSGVPESTFCQDYQGLSVRKRRKGGFVAQQRLGRLSQLAHNLMIGMKTWVTDALEESLWKEAEAPDQKPTSSLVLARKTLQERGIKRFLRQILFLRGKVVFKKQQVVGIILNPLYPLIHRIKTALEAFLKPYKIGGSVDEN